MTQGAPASRAARDSRYYAKDRWPVHAFAQDALEETPILIARKHDAAPKTQPSEAVAPAE